jgi:predicted ATP-dependent serine protease
MAMLSKGLQEASVDTVRLRDFDIVQGWEERFKRYEEMRATPNSLRGIPTGFAGLDRITHGFRPQQFVVLCGEPKRGKSLFELIFANACHIWGLPPLFVSFEMSVDEQTSRVDALAANVPYDRILSGDLSDAEMYRIKRSMIHRKNMHPFMMSEDSSSLTTVGALAGKIQEYRPAALYVDGIYLMDDENGEAKGTPQALTNISRGLKRLAQKYDIPVIGTTQVLEWKLANKRTRAITGGAIGYTSSFLQDADLILGAERNPDIDNQAIIRVVEARTAPRAEIHVQWDFTTMTFEEIDFADPLDPSYD